LFIENVYLAKEQYHGAQLSIHIFDLRLKNSWYLAICKIN